MSDSKKGKGGAVKWIMLGVGLLLGAGVGYGAATNFTFKKQPKENSETKEG